MLFLARLNYFERFFLPVSPPKKTIQLATFAFHCKIYKDIKNGAKADTSLKFISTSTLTMYWYYLGDMLFSEPNLFLHDFLYS